MRSLALLFLGFLSAFASAGVRESKEWLVDQKTHRFLRTLSEKIGTGDTEFGKDQALVTLSVSGCNLKLLVVGPVQGDARAYAKTLDDWRASQGWTGDVEWSQEDDCAAAQYVYTPGRFGLLTASTRVDLPALRAALIKVEPKTEFAVADANWSKIDLGLPPDETAPNGTRYWNLTRARPGLRAFTGTISLPAWMPWLLVAWFLIPIVGVLGGFGVGIAVARNERIPLSRRRKLYGKAVMGGTFGSMAVHGLLVLATLPTRVFEPASQLWFGQRFTQFAIPLVALFAIVPLLAFPFVNKVETKLMGPSEEEKLQQEPEAVPTREIEPVPKGTLARFSWVFTVVGLAFFAVSFFLPKTASMRSALAPIGVMVMLFPNFLNLRKTQPPKFVVEEESLRHWEGILRERVSILAGRMEMPAPPSRVLTEAIYGRFSATLDAKGVGVTIGALEGLTDPELDFLIAHELAHEKLGHLKKRKWLIYGPVAAMTLPMFAMLALRGQMSVITPGFIFTPMLIPIVLMVPYSMLMKRSMRGQEFEADRLALQVTGNSAAARSALRKITLNSTAPGIHDMDMSSHPAVDARISAMV